MKPVTKDLGKVMMTMEGEYNSEREYEVLSVVSFEDISYISKKNVPSNIPVTNKEYWQFFGSLGDTPKLRKNIEIEYIEVSYDNGEHWKQLIALSEITGPQGIEGIQGPKGEPAVAIENYITVEATLETINVTDILPSVGSADTVYRVSNWDGIQYNETTYSEYGWYNNAYKKLATRQIGIDNEPTINSQNLVKSGGVATQIGQLGQDLIKDFTDADNIYADKTFCLLNKESIQQNIDFKELLIYKKGAWMNSVGGEQVITESENHCILQFNPCGLRKFIATSESNLNLPSILIYDKQGTLIAWNPQPNMQAGVEYTWTLNPNIKIEDGCVGYINYFNYQQDTFVSSAVLEFDEPKKFADINNDITDIKNDIANIDSDIADIINLTIPYQKFIDLYSTNAGYIKPDGTAYNYYGNEYWKFSNFINCENRTIIDCNLRDGNNFVAVAFYTDKNEQSFLSSVNGNTGQPVRLNIPSGAKYVRFSSRTDYNSTSFVCWSDNSLETRVENLENTSSIIRTNKKWVAIGDSITWLDGNKQGVPQRPEHGYQHYLQQRIQFGECVNNGVSGKTMFDYPYDQITTQGDIYSIALGINDWSDTKLTPVGTLADYKNYVTATGTGEYATVTNFAEALARLIIKIKRVSTNAFVILITPKRSNSYSSQTAHFPATSIEANAGGIYLHQYADIIKEVAEYEGYPCVDLYHNGGFTDQNMSALCYDNLHPNDIGMMLIANDLYPAMEKICRSYIID